MARRVDRDGALLILGVGEWAFRNYRKDPNFPKPDDAGTYSVDELEVWQVSQEKPARGSARGVPKPKGTYPCGRCETKVPRRWKFKPTPDPADEEFLCKPCLIAADREQKTAGG